MENKKIEQLFSDDDIKYRIPIYQRHYIWTKKNWEHLWDDIRTQYEKSSKGYTSKEDETSHFTGVIVIRKDRETREIVDGQQRLTTFQIILCAIRDICAVYGYQDTASEINSDFILNEEGSEDEKFKLLPRAKSDKKAFQALVDAKADESSGAIYDAYIYFKDTIEEHVGEDQKGIEALLNNFLEGFYIDEIEVHSPRTAAKIFESLNGRGQPLAQFDHLRNNLFLRAGPASDFLYRNYWTHFNEKSDWREDKVLNSFLKNFLRAKLGTDFDNKSSLFDLYQREYRKVLRERLKFDTVDQVSLKNFLQEKLTPNFDSFDSEFSQEDAFLIVHEFQTLKRYSDCYKELADCNPENPIWFYQFLSKEFDTTCWYPLILLLKSEQKELKISDADLKSILKILESYIVRRMLCYGQKWLFKENSSNTLINELISKIRNQKNFCVNHLESYLKDLRGDTKWPDSPQVNTALRKAGEKHAVLIRYIMFKIERVMIDPEYMDRPLTSFAKLDREHVMPKSWQTAEGWKVDPRSHRKIRERNRWLHSIGNLTLLNRQVNSKKARNHKFSEKKEVYKAYSNLKITRDIEDSPDWNVKEIKERAGKMYKVFCEVWPLPNDS